MRKVLYKKLIPAEKTPELIEHLKTHNSTYGFMGSHIVDGTGVFSDFTNEGLFHQWANTFDESNEGYGNYTVALVENADGTISEVFPCNLKFVEP